MSDKQGIPAGFKVKRNITLPVLVLKVPNVPRIIKISEPMHVSTVPGKTLADGTREKPATICAVVDVETGETCNFLVPAVVQKNLDESYPDGAYVGKTFYVENLGKRKDGQRYNDFKIMEVEAEAATAPESARGKK